MEPKNGDIYLRDDDQIIIFFDPTKCHETGNADAYITAIFSMSGKWGQKNTVDYEIRSGARMQYLGNLSTVFREVLKL